MGDPLNRHSVTPENLRRIREVFESALERPLEERQAFVENACRDAILLQEVERMLAVEGQSDPLLDKAEQVSTARGSTGVCSSCEADIAASDRFCRSCGTPEKSSTAS